MSDERREEGSAGRPTWPDVDVRETFHELESRLNIADETDDVRSTALGAHPSSSYYSNPEPEMDIKEMRARFEEAASRY